VPFVDVLSVPQSFTYDVVDYVVSGSNNLNVVGGMWVMNAANGETHAFAAAQQWSAPDVTLAVGTNTISVYGTNAYGTTVHDAVVIVRGVPGTGVPFVHVTNAVVTVAHDLADYVVAGTNNPNVVGRMWLEVTENASVSFFDAGPGWQSPATALSEFGDTVTFTVFGSNQFGDLASDGMVLTRTRPTGRTNYVAHGASHVWPYLSWAEASTTLVDAVDAAAPGNTVLIFDGTHAIDNTLTIDKSLTVRSANGADMTFISGRGSHRCINLLDATLVGVTVTNGRHTDLGGGIYIDGGTVIECAINGNRADKTGGGGVWIAGTGTVLNSTFAGNSAPQGGAVWLEQGGLVRNSLVAFNTANEIGAVRLNYGGTVENCTIVSNFGIAHGGVYCVGGGLVRNSILYGNTLYEGGSNYFNVGGGMTYTRCCLYPELTGPMDGGGNITNNPRFSYSEPFPFGLHVTSPCRDIGANQSWMTPAAVDLAGQPRVYRDVVDIGAYEYQGGQPAPLFKAKIGRHAFSVLYRPFDAPDPQGLFSPEENHYLFLLLGRTVELGSSWRHDMSTLRWKLKPRDAGMIDPDSGFTVPIDAAFAKLVLGEQKIIMKYKANNGKFVVKGKASRKSGVDFRTDIAAPNEDLTVILNIDDYFRENTMTLNKHGKFKNRKKK
jgi:hypothetical protein